MSYKLFKLTEDGIVINKTEILTIPVFKEILRRDKGSHGDNDGRKKLQAFKEFAYIYQIADYTSKPNKDGSNNRERHEYAISKSGLLEDYRPDKVILEAIEIYREEDGNAARDAIKELLKTFNLSIGVFKNIRIGIETSINKEVITIELAKQALDLNQMLIEQGEKIPALIRTLEKAITELELSDLKNQKKLIRGIKKPIPSSAIPEEDY